MRIIPTISKLLANTLQDVLDTSVTPLIDKIQVTSSSRAEFGDYSSNAPLIISKMANISPMELARKIALAFKPTDFISEVFPTSPGFINFRLSHQWLKSRIHTIQLQGETYATSDIGVGKRVQVEFVSVNPTGPLHIGHARGAIIGETIARLLAMVGYSVQREYYLNDAGEQIHAFGQSAYNSYLKALGSHNRDEELSQYTGIYMDILGQDILRDFGKTFINLPVDKAVSQITDLAVKKMVTAIRQTLQRLGIQYDKWMSEKELLAKGSAFDESIKLLKQLGYLKEKDGAVWFLSTLLGDEKDHVVIRKDQRGPTYFATDIAYHYNKLVERKFDKVINVWGSDHHGHVYRLKNAITALGADASKLVILLNQIVHLKEDGINKKFSKREGNFISIDELINEVGADNCKYTFLNRSASSQMEFEITLAKKQSLQNPAYYVKYAHARACSIIRESQKRNLTAHDGDVFLLCNNQEIALLKAICGIPDIVEFCATNLATHYIPEYAYELARRFQSFYENCRVISSNKEDIPISQARLRLVHVTRIGLAQLLRLMGMSTPERM